MKRNILFLSCLAFGRAHAMQDVPSAAEPAPTTINVSQAQPTRYFGNHGYKIIADTLEKNGACVQPNRYVALPSETLQAIRQSRGRARILAIATGIGTIVPGILFAHELHKRDEVAQKDAANYHAEKDAKYRFYAAMVADDERAFKQREFYPGEATEVSSDEEIFGSSPTSIPALVMRDARVDAMQLVSNRSHGELFAWKEKTNLVYATTAVVGSLSAIAALRSARASYLLRRAVPTDAVPHAVRNMMQKPDALQWFLFGSARQQRPFLKPSAPTATSSSNSSTSTPQ